MKAAKDQSAPGALDALRRFVNTVDFEPGGVDRFGDPGAATGWLQEHGLLEESDRLDEGGRELVAGLREAFRLELLAHNGHADPESAWAALCGYADRAALGVRCSANPGDIELVATGRGAQVVAGRLFALMYDAIRTGQWQRLKACHKETCLWAFYDHSKNGSGTWCDMAVCGNRAKAQRRRRKVAS